MNVMHKIFNIKDFNLVEFQLKIAFDHHQIKKNYGSHNFNIKYALIMQNLRI